MRNIEFKYWNSSEKNMYFQQSHGWTEFPNTLEKDDVYLQSTGLKDKNGVLIYEGDIITCVGGYDYPEGTNGCEDPRQVIFEEGEWLAYCEQCNASDPLYEFDLDKIIGNIYENPELIKN